MAVLDMPRQPVVVPEDPVRKRAPAEPPPPRWTEETPRTQEDHSLQALIELSAEIHAAGDLYRVAELGLLKFMGHLGTASAALWIISKKTREPVLIRSLGIPERFATAIGELCLPKIINTSADDPGPTFVKDLTAVLDSQAMSLINRANIMLFGTLFSSGEPIGAIVLGKRVTGSPYQDSQLRVLEASLHHLGVALENTLLYASILEQNRELRQAREKLDELDQLKQEFLNNMHHEVRTPLNIMMSYLQLALDRIPADDEKREMLEPVVEQAGKLGGMLENLLTFQEIRNENVVLEVSRQDVASLVKSYFEERRPGVALDLRELTLRTAPELPDAVCDPERLLQILDALVENAAKFTPQGSRIGLRLSARKQDGQGWVCVEVVDNGPGIPAERLNIVREPFRQLDGSVTRDVGGIGLGLALAQELTERMGGRLDLESEVGLGTTCRLLLPVG